MENNNGKGIFYGVIGVATLIVAIIGATFAYFTATTRSGQLITGSAATASLDVKVDRLTGYSEGEGAASAAEAKYVMVPQLDVALGEALKGSDVTGNKACIDANGSLVCEIYKIRVANNGSAAISVSGKIDFVAYGALDAGLAVGEDGTQIQASADTLMNHLKWARLVDPTTAALTSTTEKTLLPVNPSEMTGRYQVAAADAADAIPNSLLRYDSVMYTGKDAGVYEVLPKHLYDSVETVIEVLKSMKEGITDELSYVLPHYIDNAGFLLDDTEEFNWVRAYEGHILDVYYKDIEERTESYRSVTTERMTQICREVFRQSNILLTIKGKKKKVDKERLSKILCTLD